MRALIVEDNVDLAEVLFHILEREGYEAEVVHDGISGLEYSRDGDFDVVIFDVILPGMDGFSAVQKLRDAGVQVPILMLTAKGTVPDKIEGLDSGADSYMTKPFSPQELLSRLRALTRRKTQQADEKVAFGDVALNKKTHDLECKGESVQLRNKEFLLAEIFLENPSAVLTKGQLANAAWDESPDVEDNSIEAYISMLRKKLRFLNSDVSIKTIRGVGYKLALEDE